MNIFSGNVTFLKYILYVFAFAFFIFFGFADLIFTVPPFNPPLFKGYYTIFLGGDTDMEKLIEHLSARPEINSVISYETASVSYTDYNSMKDVKLNCIDERFETRDPRRDRYMKNLRNYFFITDRGKTWKIVYVKTLRNPIFLSMLLNQYIPPGETEWHIYEYDLHEGILVVAGYTAVSLFLLMLLYKGLVYKILSFLGSLPWIYALSAGPVTDFMLFFVIGFYWSLLVSDIHKYLCNYYFSGWNDPDRKPLFIKSGIYTVFVVVSMFILIAQNSQPSGLFLALLLQGLLLSVYFLCMKFLGGIYAKKRASVHTIFAPVKIVRGLARGWIMGNERKYVLIVLCAVLLVSPFVFFVRIQGPSIALPTPVSLSPGAGISFDNLKQLHKQKKDTYLPDLSDFITHIAYQEGLAFGINRYAFPEKDSNIMRNSFVYDDTYVQVRQQQERIISYTVEWLNSVLNSLHNNSIERMLYDQKEAVAVAVKNERYPKTKNFPLWTFIFIWCIFLCPLFFLNLRFTPRLIYGVRIPILTRLKEH